MVMEALYHLGDLSIGEITQKTLSTNGNTTVVIRNLLRDGLVTKIQKTGDKRKTTVSLTSEGRKLIDRIFPLHLKAIEEHFERLSIEERNTLLTLIRKMNNIENQKIV
jgi:MarR family 2-MHQ and catechol resistance regulon transcriptional repressor